MKRRQFIDHSAKLISSLLLTSQFFIGCNREDFSRLIGKNKADLKNFDVEYEGLLSCYSSKRVKHELMGKGKIFVFCIESMVVGFSIKLDQALSEDDWDRDDEQQIVFDNTFGKKIAWKVDGRYSSICFPKKYNDVAQYFFYSEYLHEGEDIVW